MTFHIVRAIKRYHHVKVANALGAAGYRWHKPHRTPTNIEQMLVGLPRPVLLAVLARLQRPVEPIKSNRSVHSAPRQAAANTWLRPVTDLGTKLRTFVRMLVGHIAA